MADFLDFSRKKSWRKKIVPEKDRVEICGFLGFDFRIFGVPARIFPDFLGFRSENAESMSINDEVDFFGSNSIFSGRVRHRELEIDVSSWISGFSDRVRGFRHSQLEFINIEIIKKLARQYPYPQEQKNKHSGV